MSEELKAALARIACLEGEIAKRDEELAACRVAVENCEVFRARVAELDDLVLSLQCKVIERDGELAAIKAQEPVAWAGAIEYGVPLLMVEPQNWKATPLYAAPAADAWIPVSERLPGEDDQVLCWCEDETVAWAEVSSHHNSFFTDMTHELLPVTHWMPLPAAPIKIEANRHDQ